MRGLKCLLIAIAALFLTGLGAPAALAQSDYPSRPVRLIVGFIPGSPRACSAPA
jgi:tripartite-type tricarboxylate transporter receptor subunit TctC